MHRSRGASRGTGPRATVTKTLPRAVGRGPVPRHAPIARSLAGDRPPRYGNKTLPRAVGRGPVPRQATSRGTGPRATVTKTPPAHRRAWALACHTRMRAGFPRHASVYRSLAGDRPPRYGNKNAAPHRRARACPSPGNIARSLAGDRPPRYGNRRVSWAKNAVLRFTGYSRGTGPRATVDAACAHPPVGQDRQSLPVRALASPNYRGLR